MADVHDLATRSYNMSMIKGKDTKPEMIVRKFLFSKGLRYRIHNRNLPGKPDITLTNYKTVIFVNGCFWHGHEGCRYFVMPKTRTEWWKQKIEETKIRDVKTLNDLIILGWKSIIIWDCELRGEKRKNTLEKIFLEITNEINNNVKE